MFRSTTIIGKLVLNLDKVTVMLRHSVKLRCYMLFDDVAACHRAACVLCAQHITTQFYRVFKHNCNFSQVQYKLPDDSRRPKHVGAIFVCILM